MSKSANPGELRTPVKIVSIKHDTDEEANAVDVEENVFGEGATVCVKWVNAHGSEALEALQLKLREPATLTMRYSGKIKADCLIYKAEDPEPYEIISIDNVEERGAWMEIKVQRRVAAR